MFQSEAWSPIDDAPATFSRQSEQSLLQCFKSHFATVDADRPPFVGDAYRLRYQIYCVEKGFEDSTAHPNELEKDEFDSHAVQSLLLDRATGIALGTARLVLPLSNAPDRSFAIQRIIAPRVDEGCRGCAHRFDSGSVAFQYLQTVSSPCIHHDECRFSGGLSKRSADASWIDPDAYPDECRKWHHPLVLHHRTFP